MQRSQFRASIEQQFCERWAGEADAACGQMPITAFVAVIDREIAGFGVCECTRRGYFGPTGVRDDLRGAGIGAALLFRCLASMYEMGYAYPIIGGAQEAVPFYEYGCGATVIPRPDPGICGR